MKDKQIEVLNNWPEPTLIKDIQVFIVFANFYQRFIQGFNKIAAPLTSILKTTRSSKELVPKVFGADANEIAKGGSEVNKMFKILSKSKKLKNKKSENLVHVQDIVAM